MFRQANFDPAPPTRSALEDADDLTMYAWLFRCPGAPYESEAAATQALRTATLAVREIERRLPV